MKMENHEILAECFPFWDQLTDGDRGFLEGSASRRRYRKGENVHGGGLHCTGVIAIASGRLRVYLLSPEGKEVTLFRLLERDVCMLSASCLIKNIAFDVYVDAEADTEILLISPATYEAASARSGLVASYVQDIITMRFSEAVWVMEQILFMNMDRRLAIFLLEQSSLEEDDTLRLTHQEIADHMATAREVVSRMLKYFAQEGLVAVSRKGIRLLDRKRLEGRAL